MPSVPAPCHRFTALLFALGLLFFSALAHAQSLIDINSAGVSELVRLPGVGASRAQAIIDYRTQNGPFRSIEDLVRVPGIGPATMNNLRSMVTIGESQGGAQPASPAPQAAAPAAQPGAAPAPAAPENRGMRAVTELDLHDGSPPASPPPAPPTPAPQPAAPAAAPAPAPAPASAPAAGRSDLININTAGVSELVRLPGVGASRAQAIIDYRTQNGPFRSIEDLVRVSGIGPATMNNVRSMITVGEE